MLDSPRSAGMVPGSSSINGVDPRSLNSIYNSSKPTMNMPASPRAFANRGAASAVGHDGYVDDEEADEGADGDDDFDDDESTPLNGSRRRRRRQVQRQRRERSEARQMRKSMLTSFMIVMALLIGFSLGVVYVTS